METQKSLERVLSQKAMQMGNSFPCQICVVGFLSGVCLTSFFLAVLGTIGFSGISVSNSWISNSSQIINVVTSRDCKIHVVETNSLDNSDKTRINANDNDHRIALLHSSWTESLSDSLNESYDTLRLNKPSPPNAPHLENCKSSQTINKYLDTRVGNESHPPWTTWKGLLGIHPAAKVNGQLKHTIFQGGALPPWVIGSDEENYPLTRKVQRDIWTHQHPVNCGDSSVRFLVADWERLPGFGIGAQLAGMCGLLAIAIKEKRVLVTSYYNRADHDGCKGSSRSSWSCYFLPETSQECRDRAFELVNDKQARETGVITTKDDYKSKEIWSGKTPRIWGDPWSFMQPTTEINGSLITSHRKMDRRWWRAQAIRYLMRFQTEYTCNLMNVARNAAFGKEVAKMVLESVMNKWPKGESEKSRSEIEEYVWSNYEKPWIPRPMLSMHVRMGDKACEMKVVEFEEYMRLADRIRHVFPQLNSIWLSTEMQEVIDKSKEYGKWKFYYSEVTRQVGNMTMAKYETSLGRKTSTNYPLVNFIMATEADFFIGALGSTWCYLIDGMRNTGGKVMAGYLSVNKDRFW